MATIPLTINGAFAIVPLTKGRWARVDVADWERISHRSWAFKKTGYAQAKLRGRQVLLHRFVLGDECPAEVDHINRDRLDCRRSNLRPATRSQTNMNKRSRHARPLKGITLIRYRSGNTRWQAQIGIDGKSIYLGVFNTREQAAEAYKKAAAKHFKEFACAESH